MEVSSWSDTETQRSLFSHLLANLSHVSTGQHLQVGGQGAGLQDAAVLLLVVGLPKQDVVTQRGVLDPGLLRDVGHRALGKHRQAGLLYAIMWCYSFKLKKESF